MGKTQIASEFVYRLKRDFDAIFWVHADEPSKIAHDFSHVVATLELVSEDSVEARNNVLTRDLVLGWLTAWTTRVQKKLLVLWYLTTLMFVRTSSMTTDH